MSEYHSRLTFFDKLVADRNQEGWDYVGMDQTHETKFTEGAKFTEVQVRTLEEIVESQKKRLMDLVRSSNGEGNVIVELVPVGPRKVGELELPNKYGQVYVFAKLVR